MKSFWYRLIVVVRKTAVKRASSLSTSSGQTKHSMKLQPGINEDIYVTPPFRQSDVV